ncbi:MAG TPA: hypothetical protein ENI51_02475 [Candidatus Atribacteria bacterium]|nr:hypothetical protein [Candidatus Atribacteria bacterium]
MNKEKQIQFIVFSDIMYGVVMGIGFNFLIHTIDSLSLSSLILIIWVYFLICDDWFGAHYMASHYSYNVWIFFIDILIMLNFIFLIYFASKTSIYMFIPMIIYPFLSFFWNNAYIAICKNFPEEQTVLKIWRIGSIVLLIIYAILLSILYALKIQILNLKLAIVTFFPWLIWRVILAWISRHKVGKIV